MNKKIFFLDFDERNDKECLASKLLQLGGKLETFLSKKVNFIVSNASQNVKSMPSKKPIHQSRAMNMVLKSQKRP